MKNRILYLHGKGGSVAEAAHYQPLFPDGAVIGFDYHAETPWEAQKEFADGFDEIARGADVTLIANSIGAYFALCALGEKKIKQAFFISPIVDMERLIGDMMTWAGVSERELAARREIPTAFGETLSWDYLTWVRAHPIVWHTPTEILCGSGDTLQSEDTIRRFADRCDAGVTVMPNGEHWFHTEEEMRFLDGWLRGFIQ